MREPHRHQHDAAARLLIRLHTVHPWGLRFGRRLAPTAPCWSAEDIRASFSRRLGSKLATFAYLNHSASGFLAPPDLPEPPTAATMSMTSFPTQLQIIPYIEPPKQKPRQPSRRNPSKTAFNGYEYLALDGDLSIGLTPASQQAGDFDSTSSKHF
jgi:hypothetical protein